MEKLREAFLDEMVRLRIGIVEGEPILICGS